ncbi:MAG: sigma-70 family RNA polymerase sigma factor [Planctomycetaceae bacterium]|nr:sigma-70 family RNA polymerase sigma factor [Planctomycetaceae bacterium]
MWPEGDHTRELLNGAKDGDDLAAGELLDRHREALRRMVAMRLDRRIQQRVDASDIVQEVMIEANRRLNRYLDDPVMPFHLWLRQMAKDRIIDAHRRHRASGKRSVDREQGMVAPAAMDRSTMELAAQLCDPELTPAAAATMQELQRRFQAAIDTMDENDREIVMMRHFEQLSNQDVAQSLNLSEPAASMRYLRAMRRLRKLLSEPSDEGEPA